MLDVHRFLHQCPKFGYFAVAALILFENVFPPIPSELILPLSGFLATQTEMTFPGVIIVVAVGVVAWWVKFRVLPARAEQKRREAEGK